MQFPFIAPVQLTTEDPAATGRIAAVRGFAGLVEDTFDMSRLLPDGESDKVPSILRVVTLDPSFAGATKIGSTANRAIEAILVAAPEVSADGDKVPALPDAETFAEIGPPSQDLDETTGVMGRPELAGLRATPKAGISSEATGTEGDTEVSIDPMQSASSDPPLAPELLAQSQPRANDANVAPMGASPALPSAHSVAARQPEAPMPQPRTAQSGAISGVDGKQDVGGVGSAPPAYDRVSAPMRTYQAGPQRPDAPLSESTPLTGQVTADRSKMSGAPQVIPGAENAGDPVPRPGVADPRDSLGDKAAMANAARNPAESFDRSSREMDPVRTRTPEQRIAEIPHTRPVATRTPRENSVPLPGDAVPSPAHGPLKSRKAVGHGPLEHVSRGVEAAEIVNPRPTRQSSPGVAFGQPAQAPQGAPTEPKGFERPSTFPLLDLNSAASPKPTPHEVAGAALPGAGMTHLDYVGREVRATSFSDRPETSDRLARAAFRQDDGGHPARAFPLSAPLPFNWRSPDAPVPRQADAGFAGGVETIIPSDVVTPRTAPDVASSAPLSPPVPQSHATASIGFEVLAQPETREPAADDVDALPTEIRVTEARPSPTTSAPGTPPHPARHDPGHVSLQIADAIRTNGERATELHLQPEELGRVRFSVSHDGAGLSVSLSVERPDTLDLIRRHVDLLADDLRRIGYSAVNFSFDGGGAHQRQAHANAAPETAASPVPPDEMRPPPALADPSEQTSPTRPAASGMDIRL